MSCISPASAAESVASEPLSVLLPASTVPSFSTYQQVRYFSSLDAFRCASILAVIWHHTPVRLEWLPASYRGFLGVDMFFVISGFLIVTLLLRERRDGGGISLTHFYARRFLRIFPVYYGLLAALVAASWLLAPQSNTTASLLGDMPFLATYTTNWVQVDSIMAIAWSLAAEEQFYMFWPPLEKLLRRTWIIAVLLGLIGLNQLVNFKLADPLLERMFGLTHADLPMLQATFTPICLGVLLAHVLDSSRCFSTAARFLGRRWSPLMMLAIVIGTASMGGGDIAGWPRLLIQISMMLLLCSCVVREDHMLGPILTLWPLQRVGVVSYGMYLFHMFAMHAATTTLGAAEAQSPWAYFILTVLITIIVAEISFRWYEAPFVKLKTKFAHRPSCARPYRWPTRSSTAGTNRDGDRVAV